MDVELDAEEKTVIIAAAGTVVALVVVITACFVIPGCCGYRCLQSRKRKNSYSDKIIMLELPKKKISIKLSDNMNPLYQSVGPQFEMKETQGYVNKVFRSSFNGNIRPMSILLPEVPKTPPVIRIKIAYSADKDLTSLGRLLVQIIGAENLPVRDYPTLPDSSIKLEVIHRRWTFSRQEHVVHDVQTRVVRSSSSPVFEQNFTFAAAVADIKVWCLKISVYDEDRHTRCRETCCGRLNLRDVKGLTEGEVCPVNFLLEPVNADMGQLLVALSYLPTSQRLSVNIMKASRLLWPNGESNTHLLRPCVKVALLDHTGRVLKKKKIIGDNIVDSPLFDGNACFEIAPMVYDTATLLLVVSSELLDGWFAKKPAEIIGEPCCSLLVGLFHSGIFSDETPADNEEKKISTLLIRYLLSPKIGEKQ